MKINENEIVKEAICVFNGYLRIEYDRNDDKILFKPCCEAVPKSLDQLRIDSNYFINNVEKCIHDFENLNLRVLTKYYTGNCYITEQHSGINNLCENYLFNKKINWIENSILTGCNLNCIMCVRSKLHTGSDIYCRIARSSSFCKVAHRRRLS